MANAASFPWTNVLLYPPIQYQTMQEKELRFRTLKDLIEFKQQVNAKELRIDTNDKLLTGQFTETEVEEAVRVYKATLFTN